MRAELRSFFCPDLDLDSRHGVAQADGFLLTLLVGPIGEPGEESFDITVCTPHWLEKRVEHTGGPVIGRHLLVVSTVDMNQIIAFVGARIAELEAPTWNELAGKIGRLGYWEFEDYRE